MQDYSASIARIESTHNRIHWNMPFESTRTEVSRGTGFFIDIGNANPIRDQKGNIGRFMLTCAHVVKDTEISSLRVVLGNDLDRRYNAATVQTCPDIDVAVVLAFLPETFRVNYLPIGNSDNLEAHSNRSVTAVGFPLGGGIKVSEGVFSGIARGKGIQHTSPISPGSSGCPLLNSKNEVVGINYQGEVAATVSNIHYAVAINLAMVIIHDATATKQILYRVPRLGVCFQNMSRDMLRHVQKNLPEAVEGVILHRFEQECIKNLIHHNPSKYAIIAKNLGDGSGQHQTDRKTATPSQSFFLTSIAWDGENRGTDRYKTAIRGLLQKKESNVDMNGLVAVAWTQQKIPLESLLNRIPASFSIKLRGWFNPIGGTPNPLELVCTKRFHSKGVLKTLHYPYFEAPAKTLRDTYFCFMGMCVVLLHFNHYQYLREVMCIPRYGLRQLRFVVIKIFDQSDLADAGVFRPGDELECLVTDKGEQPIECESMGAFKKLVCECIRTHGKLGIKNKNNRWFHMEVEAMLKQEELMLARTIYTPDPELMQALKGWALQRGAEKLQSSPLRLQPPSTDDSIGSSASAPPPPPKAPHPPPAPNVTKTRYTPHKNPAPKIQAFMGKPTF